ARTPRAARPAPPRTARGRAGARASAVPTPAAPPAARPRTARCRAATAAAGRRRRPIPARPPRPARTARVAARKAWPQRGNATRGLPSATPVCDVGAARLQGGGRDRGQLAFVQFPPAPEPPRQAAVVGDHHQAGAVRGVELEHLPEHVRRGLLVEVA